MSLRNRDIVIVHLGSREAHVVKSLVDIPGTVVFCGANGGGLAAAQVAGRDVYVCGDLSLRAQIAKALAGAASCSVIDDLSTGGGNGGDLGPTVRRGMIPISHHGLGVQYRDVWGCKPLFWSVRQAHEFQELTESTKPSTAHRTGIYLTPVVDVPGCARKFRLLRCSANLRGPTDTFRQADWAIVDRVNELARQAFDDPAPLNHVLAQIYHNTPEFKAKIKAHADKTKDMPANGLFAFCTFYDGLSPERRDPADFDHKYKKASVLTDLVFRRKPGVGAAGLPDTFSVKLYPGSVFLMPLSTNRLYTHEIRPSTLSADKIPTRMGYVIRCSDTQAVHTAEGETCIVGRDGGLTPMRGAPTDEEMAELRDLYYRENLTDEVVDYGDTYFSMNKGDYLQPLL